MTWKDRIPTDTRTIQEAVTQNPVAVSDEVFNFLFVFILSSSLF